MMRVCVTGGRDYRDAQKVRETLDNLDVTVLIEGGARGADRLAREWALAHSIPVITFEADWETHGRSAGPRRNRKMLEEGRPDLVVAFPGGAGTLNCVDQAVAHNLRVKLIP